MKKTILFVLLITSIVGFGQRQSAANKFFEEFAYKKSAELYELIYEKGDTSQVVLSRLADSYYYNAEFEKAEKWYKKLMQNFEKEETTQHFFRYAQVLKSNGNVTESDKWLQKLKVLKETDSRAVALEENEDYFVKYTNKEQIYVDIYNVSTNTKYSDFGGFLYNDRLYFASTKPTGLKNDDKIYDWNKQPFLNIYSSELKEVDENRVFDVSEAEKLVDLNTRYHESNIIITSDGNTIYFTRDNYDGKKLRKDEDRTVHLKIYKARKENNKWVDVKELSFNTDDYSCGHPALSPDEKTLYFVSDMPGGFGETDIYKVAVLENDTYGVPVNLGKQINTESREMFPFVGADNTFYFASDGHLGLGALDIFESKIKNKEFTNPINLGAPVNGPKDDFSFVINKEKSKGFFSSNRKKGKGDDDIYSFLIYDCKQNIAGVVTNSITGKPMPDVQVMLIDDQGNPISEQATKEDGSYVFETIDCERKFTVTASKEDYRKDQKDTQTLDVNKETVKTNLQLESLIVADQIVINPIYFDFDLANIREDAEYELEHIVSVMKNHPEMVIKIESHTDSRGTKGYNKSLSTNRAISTRDYIVSRGIASNRIKSALGFGESQLLNDCDDANKNKCTKEEHQKNRRSYFYILEGKTNVKTTN
ncbi:OmpA family protein [Tenacibaculum retecalamus]|uniref:OmpA family protein n=1 Tax=Tenacibaculum retecalamus TaxID=3018315 RepID=UPI0023D9200B|nr:OmpA family protein [Tenacibaculum retecalamus]WBX71842.1 OmpA family protein [Tenacibaculum retecalamus]